MMRMYTCAPELLASIVIAIPWTTRPCVVFVGRSARDRILLPVCRVRVVILDRKRNVGDTLELSGRLGAPYPEHRGLPPIHFEKMTCTACHSGPMPTSHIERQINSIAHRLGEHIKRTGVEQPALFAGVNLRVDYAESAEGDSSPDQDFVYTPHRLFWPSFWATVSDDGINVLNPESVYDLVRRPLRVRRDFTEDLSDAKLGLSERKEILGDERARLKEDEMD